MAQWGAAADTGGLRTTPETVQSVIGALYSNIADSPIISGGVVTGRADLAFDVSATVAAHKTPAGAVYVASDAVTTALITPPASGTQTWIVYMDADGQVNVGTSPVAPYVTIGQYNVPASCKATSSLTNTWNTNYALPFGASLNQLVGWQENAVPGQVAADSFVATLQFYVPTDRRIITRVVQELKMADPPDNSTVVCGAVGWTLTLDGGADQIHFELPVDRTRCLRSYDVPWTVNKGTHSIAISRHTSWLSTGNVVYHFGGDADGFQHGYYEVRDDGIAK